MDFEYCVTPLDLTMEMFLDFDLRITALILIVFPYICKFIVVFLTIISLYICTSEHFILYSLCLILFCSTFYRVRVCLIMSIVRFLLLKYLRWFIPDLSIVLLHGERFSLSGDLNSPDLDFDSSPVMYFCTLMINFCWIYFHCCLSKYFHIFKRFLKLIIFCLLFGHLNFAVPRLPIVLIAAVRILLFGHLNLSYLFYYLPVINCLLIIIVLYIVFIHQYHHGCTWKRKYY